MRLNSERILRVPIPNNQVRQADMLYMVHLTATNSFKDPFRHMVVVGPYHVCFHEKYLQTCTTVSNGEMENLAALRDGDWYGGGRSGSWKQSRHTVRQILME